MPTHRSMPPNETRSDQVSESVNSGLDRLCPGGHPTEVLRALYARALQFEMPPPAALVGRWFGASAVIAPRIARRDVFQVDRWCVHRPLRQMVNPKSVVLVWSTSRTQTVKVDIPQRPAAGQFRSPVGYRRVWW